MDDCDAIVIDYNSDFQWDSIFIRSNEHGHALIICGESLPVISEGVNHVVISDAVLASRWIDVHGVIVTGESANVNKC